MSKWLRIHLETRKTSNVKFFGPNFETAWSWLRVEMVSIKGTGFTPITILSQCISHVFIWGRLQSIAKSDRTLFSLHSIITIFLSQCTITHNMINNRVMPLNRAVRRPIWALMGAFPSPRREIASQDMLLLGLLGTWTDGHQEQSVVMVKVAHGNGIWGQRFRHKRRG